MNIAITGHRPNKLGNDYDLKSPLIQWIKDQIIRRVTHFHCHEDVTCITGMALGIDTLFAQIAVELGHPFIAAIPMKGQERMWPEKSQDLYHHYLARAQKIYVTDINKYVTYSEFLDLPFTLYSPFKMQKRNEWMTNTGDEIIGVWDGTSGGTANCIKYAEKVGKPITIINPNNFKL